MKAIVFDRFGGPDVLRVSAMPTPEPAEGEVRIAVVATSVNPVDWKVREGLLQERMPHELPIIPGWDAAGTIDSLGASVTGFRVGDRVWAYCRKPTIKWGTYAEFVTMDAAAVARMPPKLDFASAAAMPLVGLTAWQALFDVGHVIAGQTLLVHGGSGGIGSLAIQLGRHAGARVVTTARPENHDYVRGLGAEAAIDYTAGDWVAAARRIVPEGFDAVLIAVGGEAVREGYGVLRPGGILVSITGAPDAAEAERHCVRAEYLFVSPSGHQLAELGTLVENGSVKPPLIEELPLASAAEAQRRSAAGHVRGKLVLRVR